MATATTVVLAAACSASACSAAASSKARSSAGITVATTADASTSTSTTSTSTPATVAVTTPAPRPRSSTTTAKPAASTAAPTAGAPACSGLANELASTGAARQLITVEAQGWGATTAQVELWQKSGSCWAPAAGPWPGWIGENGFSSPSKKTEGDGTTPTGMYGVGSVMYGNSPDPGVHETYVHLVDGDWWDENPGSSGYNTFQARPPGDPGPGGGSEALWKYPQAYASFAVIDYNTGPVVPYKGSAIFFHAETGGPTAGCVSVPLADLDYALDWIQPAAHPAFVMGPAQVITSY